MDETTDEPRDEPDDPPGDGRSRVLACGAILTLCAAVAGLWWPSWVLDYGRSEPWRTALCWAGDLAALAWCLRSAATGRPLLAAVPGGWATAGMLLTVFADLGVTGSLLYADRVGYQRGVPAVGRVVAVRWPGRVGDEGGRPVDLWVRFPQAGGGFETGGTQLTLGLPADDGKTGRFPADAADWCRGRLAADADPAAPDPGPPPTIGLRYDPAWPGRFWTDTQLWHSPPFCRFLMAVTGVSQAALLLYYGVRKRGERGEDRELLAGPGAVVVMTLPALLLSGLVDRGWV